MEIIRFDDPLLFQGRVQNYLVRREAENNLLLGILANVIGGEYRDIQPYLSLAEDDRGEVCAVSLCTPPYPVLLSYEFPNPESGILEALLADFQEGLGDDFCGLSANKEFVTPLVAAWEANSGKKACLEMAMRIYKLEAVQTPADVPGQIRLAEKGDRQLLLDWYAGFHRDAMGEEPTPRRVRRQVDAYLRGDLDQRGLMIWIDRGIPVSMAGYSGPTPNGMRVGAVYTPPDQRRKGYASACTAALSKHLLERGFQFCFLFTDLLNPTSNHIYQQIGYRPICDVDRYIF
jgi:predicted GNAT family acetyltransferase